MLSKKIAIEVLNKMLETGADYSEIFYEDSVGSGITIENGKVSTSSTGITSGVGLRILKENRCVYGYTSDLSKKGLMSLADSLNKSFNGKRILTVDHLDYIKAPNRNPIKRSYKSLTQEEKISLIKEGTNAIEELKDPRIVRYIGSFGNNYRFVAIFNSKGKWFKKET